MVPLIRHFGRVAFEVNVYFGLKDLENHGIYVFGGKGTKGEFFGLCLPKGIFPRRPIRAFLSL